MSTIFICGFESCRIALRGRLIVAAGFSVKKADGNLEVIAHSTELRRAKTTDQQFSFYVTLLPLIVLLGLHCVF